MPAGFGDFLPLVVFLLCLCDLAAALRVLCVSLCAVTAILRGLHFSLGDVTAILRGLGFSLGDLTFRGVALVWCDLLFGLVWFGFNTRLFWFSAPLGDLLVAVFGVSFSSAFGFGVFTGIVLT